ncbi:MAG: hypothetical protein U0903_11205 [Planctomycetales bacterium]
MSDLPAMVLAALAGGAIAGLNGILHDNITYSISPEYFTKLKFNQFRYADLGLGDRAYASTIGFLATWWVGAIAAWFLARRLVPNQPRPIAFRQIAQGFLCVLAFGFCFGLIGFLYGLWRGPDADYSLWEGAFQQYDIVHKWSFVRVAYIHNAGYLGGLLGLITALLLIRPQRNTPA